MRAVFLISAIYVALNLLSSLAAASSCDHLPAGYFTTDRGDCVTLYGSVRQDLRIVDTEAAYRFRATPVRFRHGFDTTGSLSPGRFQTQSRATLGFDWRTGTEFGLVRATAEAAFEWNGSSAPVTHLDTAYLQISGLTLGRRQSFFDHIGTGERWYALNPTTARPWSDAKVDLMALTVPLADRLDATVSLEDASTGARARNGARVEAEAWLMDLPSLGRTMARDGLVQGGADYPDIIFAAVLTRDWGTVQVMSAVHRLRHDRARSYAGFGPAGTDGFGMATGAAVTLELPWIGHGDRATLQAVQTRGATAYATATLWPFGNLGADAVFDWSGRLSDRPEGTLRLTSARSVAGAYRRRIAADFDLVLNGGHVVIDGAGPRDFAVTDLAADGHWRPAAGLLLATSVEMRRVAFTGATRRAYSGRPGPGEFNPTVRHLRNARSWAATVRMERSF